MKHFIILNLKKILIKNLILIVNMQEKDNLVKLINVKVNKINNNMQLKLLNKTFYYFKSKKDFDKEFDFNKGKYLGKGAFGLVKKC